MPLDTTHKLKVHNTFRRLPGRLLKSYVHLTYSYVISLHCISNRRVQNKIKYFALRFIIPHALSDRRKTKEKQKVGIKIKWKFKLHGAKGGKNTFDW